MVYSRNSIQHVDMNWGLDSGEVSIVDWPIVLHLIQSCTFYVSSVVLFCYDVVFKYSCYDIF